MNFEKKRIWSSKRGAGISAVLGALVLTVGILQEVEKGSLTP